MSLGRKSVKRTGKAKPSKQPKAAKDPKTLLLTWGLHERSASDGVMPGPSAMPKQVRNVGSTLRVPHTVCGLGRPLCRPCLLRMLLRVRCASSWAGASPVPCMAGVGVLVGLRSVHVSRTA